MDWQITFSAVDAVATALGAPAIVAYAVLMHKQTQRMTDQMQLNERAVRASVYNSIAAQMLDIDRLFFDHPEYRCFFYDGVEPNDLDPIESSRVRSIAEMIVDFADNFAIQERSIPPNIKAVWQAYFQFLFTHSPPLRAYWTENSDWYSEELIIFLDLPPEIF